MYESDLGEVSHCLTKAIYMLHYVPEGHFREVERQDVCFLLERLRESFKGGHKM